MTHASLFSGIGGFDLAAEWAGFENLFNCEIDPFCRKVLKYHFPNAEQYEDIRTTDFTQWRGRIDVLTGGFPCQPFSVAGQRKGAGDDRFLWPEMLRVISDIRPAWVIGENVGGIVGVVEPGCEVDVETQASLFDQDYTETEEHQQFVIERICRELERIGYSVQPVLIPACGVGAPHRRDRVWFVAQDTERVRCDGSEPEKESEVGRLGEFSARNHVRVCGEPGTTADSSDAGIEAMQESPICTDTTETAAHTEGIGLSVARETWDGRRRPENVDCRERNTECGWQNFPTQSPVCCGDDGLPGGLDGITIPAWRLQSIKAYGNAIVPQVAYQIFETIKRYENLCLLWA